MEQFPIRYPQTEHRRYTPGGKGLNKHYKAHRVQFFGQKGIIKTEFRIIHRNPSVGLFTDQRGIPSFAYKIPNGKMYKTAPQMDKIPRGGNVPRVVGTLGDVFQDILDEGPPGPASILRNKPQGFGGIIDKPVNTTTTTTSTGAQTNTPANPSVGSELQLTGKTATDVYQTDSQVTKEEEFIDMTNNEFQNPKSVSSRRSSGSSHYSDALLPGEVNANSQSKKEAKNPVEDQLNRMNEIYNEYPDGDAQVGYTQTKKEHPAEEYNPLNNGDRIRGAGRTVISFPGVPGVAQFKYVDEVYPQKKVAKRKGPLKESSLKESTTALSEESNIASRKSSVSSRKSSVSSTESLLNEFRDLNELVRNTTKKEDLERLIPRMERRGILIPKVKTFLKRKKAFQAAIREYYQDR
jgi:hypothetical protein